MKDIRLKYTFKNTFNPGGLTFGLMNGVVFLQKEFETPPSGRSSLLSNTIVPKKTVHTLLLVNALIYSDLRVPNKKLHATRVVKSGSSIRLVVQIVVKAWSILIRK